MAALEELTDLHDTWLAAVVAFVRANPDIVAAHLADALHAAGIWAPLADLPKARF